MTEQSPQALDEVVREFTRAREGLASVVGKLDELDSAEKARREQADAFAAANGSFDALAEQLRSIVPSLDAAVAAVSKVLEEAQGALRATDAGQLVSKLDALTQTVSESARARDETQQEAGRQVASLESTVQAAADGTEARLRAIEEQAAGNAETLGVIQARLDELVQLRQDNAVLRSQIAKVKAGLKPRQIAALGLD